MLYNKTVAVVVPAYNEETQIGRVIETMPNFVDRIIIVNDKSNDRTLKIAKSYFNTSFNNTDIIISDIYNKIIKNHYNYAEIVTQNNLTEELKFFPKSVIESDSDSERIVVINNLHNTGVGGAIARGYKWSKDHGIECTAVMAGDGQMDPNELESICYPVIKENIDYVKGNRLIHRSSWLVIPKTRYFGNSILSILTKIASGYWHISDTQTGYTAISKPALNSIRIHKIYKSYGMPNDILVKLNIAMCTIKEIEIKPVYSVGEQSKMKIIKVIPKISFLLFKSFFKRLWIKYMFRDFHPLFLLYNLSFILFVMCIPYGVKIFSLTITGEVVNPLTFIAFVFLFISSFQSLLFAMWMDIQDNDRLYK